MTEIDWRYVLGLFADGDFWRAAGTVVLLSVLTWCLGIGFGLGLALGKASRFTPLRLGARAYIWFFRSLPLLVLLIFVYNLPQLVPAASGVLSDPFRAGLVALVASESAYLAEILRGGLLGVPAGQHEAGRALGIGFVGRLRLIVVPQAFRLALPSLANEFITIVKLTSLVSVISLAEILLVGQRLYTQNFKVLDTLIVVAAFYVGIVTVFNALVGALERRLDVTRARERAAPPPPDAPRPARPEAPPRRALAPDSPVLIEVEGVSKRLGARRVLDDVSLRVRQGEVVSIIGPSGSGKTTLFRTFNGLQDIDAGRIRFDGRPWIDATGPGEANGNPGRNRIAPDFRRRITGIGMLFQSFNLFPHLSVLQNVTLAVRHHGRARGAAARELGMAALARVEMQAHAHKYPHQLSGGQQQRVAIARALAMAPRVMLFDEPTSALDPELVNEVLRTIEALAESGMTMVIVTHEMRFARRISDRIVFMEDGRVVADEAPATLFGGGHARVAAFLRESAQ
ncbi:amino acid ABC transporter permease/ATP-binding protein [Burkholderia plantarii]|uniref:amino acid ABC transporter permease/ATP-binding protein n=1 Tax=Burkholderia plantarii TaxID=41899 RepID=UPI0018DCBCAD|nr:amino acid ABC transporter permease/ATP-binding protein [Burkholderia plantarii]MBI0328006.1 amino acid ABC transporter permease/ATP-binding protein [Burkholderia plantarii]